MKRKSHKALGKYLLKHYMPGLTFPDRSLFLFGCIQPDQNPITYLKGSFRGTWLHGHNYKNAERFLLRLCHRLEKRKHLSPWDYYTTGKLMHYTLDAFTFSHNLGFPSGLKIHRQYEAKLQTEFLSALASIQEDKRNTEAPLYTILENAHTEYLSQPGCPKRDIEFALYVSTMLTKRIASKC